MLKRILITAGSFALIVSLIFNIGAFGIVQKNLDRDHNREYAASLKLSYFATDVEKSSESISNLVDSADYRYPIFQKLVDSTFKRLYKQQLDIMEFAGGLNEETGTLMFPESIGSVHKYFRTEHTKPYTHHPKQYFDTTINNYLKTVSRLFPEVKSNLAHSFSNFQYHKYDDRAQIFTRLNTIESLILINSIKQKIVEDQLLVIDDVSF